MERVLADKSHAASLGYTCYRPLKLITIRTVPIVFARRCVDGPTGLLKRSVYDTASAEIADKFKEMKPKYGGEAIFGLLSPNAN